LFAARIISLLVGQCQKEIQPNIYKSR